MERNGNRQNLSLVRKPSRARKRGGECRSILFISLILTRTLWKSENNLRRTDFFCGAGQGKHLHVNWYLSKPKWPHLIGQLWGEGIHPWKNMENFPSIGKRTTLAAEFCCRICALSALLDIWRVLWSVWLFLMVAVFEPTRVTVSDNFPPAT